VLCSGDPLVCYSTIQKLTLGRHGRGRLVPVSVAFVEQERIRTNGISLTTQPTYSAQHLSQFVYDAADKLAATNFFCQLQKAIASTAVPPNMDKIVAFALGSLTYLSEPNPDSVMQHALLLTLRKVLSPAHELKCYSQDPLYTTPDQEALAMAGVDVLNDPDAFLKVDDNSVLLSISPDVPVRQVIADLCRPVIIIWEREAAPYPSCVSLPTETLVASLSS